MSNIVSFSELFENKFFRIPDYQRGYSWGNKEIDVFYQDLDNVFGMDNVHFTGVIMVNRFNESDFQCFFREGFEEERTDIGRGQITFGKKAYDLYNIVDGQQRFTTILIFMFCLIEKLENEDKKKRLLEKYFRTNYKGENKYFFGYHIDVPSRNYLVNTIFEDDNTEDRDKETLYTNNLLNAKKRFSEKLRNYDEGDISIFIDIIENKLKFFLLELEDNVDISMVFETTNFRGKELSALERFKNRVFYLLSNDNRLDESVKDEKRLEINETWLEIYRWLGKEGSKNINEDDFLKAFWIIRFSDETCEGEEPVREEFKQYQKHLFDMNFNKNSKGYRVRNNVGVDMPWLEEMRNAIALWYFINNPYEVDNDEEFNYQYTEKIQRSLYRIAHFSNGLGKFVQVFILALFRLLPRKEEDIEQGYFESIEEILYLVERHNIMMFLITGKRTHYNQEEVFRVALRFYSKNRTIPNELIDITKELFENIFVKEFSWKEKNNNWNEWVGRNFFLREYEEGLSGKMNKKEFVVKQIYPSEEYDSVRKEYKNFVNSQIATRNIYSNSLGNLLITNGKNSPKNFENLKEEIRKTTRDLTESEREIVKCYDDWTQEAIIERGRKIIDFICDKWDIPKPKSDTEYRRLLGQQK